MNETVTVDGRDAVVRRLHGSEPSLVLVHGAGGNHHFWDGLLSHLGGLDVVVPSLPGRCGSNGEALGSVSEMAAWLRSLLRKLGVRRAIIAGHSLGGAVALEYAIQQLEAPRPELAGVVLMATGARLRVQQLILDAVADAAETGIHATLGSLAYLPDTSPELIGRLDRLARLTPPATTMVDWQAVHSFDRMEGVAKVGCPTLVLGGALDELTPTKYHRFLEERIDGARLELLEGGGHMFPVERAQDVGRLLHAFVTDS